MITARNSLRRKGCGPRRKPSDCRRWNICRKIQGRQSPYTRKGLKGSSFRWRRIWPGEMGGFPDVRPARAAALGWGNPGRGQAAQSLMAKILGVERGLERLDLRPVG